MPARRDHVGRDKKSRDHFFTVPLDKQAASHQMDLLAIYQRLIVRTVRRRRASRGSAVGSSPALARKHRAPIVALILICLQYRINQAGLTGKILVRCKFHASHAHFSYIGQKPYTLLETYRLIPHAPRRSHIDRVLAPTPPAATGRGSPCAAHRALAGHPAGGCEVRPFLARRAPPTRGCGLPAGRALGRMPGAVRRGRDGTGGSQLDNPQ